jgi:sec-independent protein translocase protein TatA
MGSLSVTHWIIIAVVLVVLFGSKKLPDAARGLGRSLRILKSEVKEMNNDDAPAPAATVETPAQLPAPAPLAQPAPQQPAAAPVNEQKSA